MGVDRLPVAARDQAVSSKPFSIVRRISGSSASGGAPAASRSEPAARLQRDEVVGGDRRARVVGGAPVVGEPNGSSPSVRASQPPTSAPRRLGGHGRERAVELLGAPRSRGERLQGMQAEAALVRLERGQRRRAADVGDPRAGRQLAATSASSPGRDAEQDEPGSPADRSSPRSADGRPSPRRRVRADHLGSLDHVGGSSSVFRIPG